MDPAFITGLALCVLVVGGFVLLDRRLARIAGDLDRLDGIDELADRVRSLAGELDRKELNAQIQAKITEFTESNRRLTATVADLHQELDELRRAAEARVENASRGGPQDAADVASIVRGHLDGAGYEDVQILSDLSQLQGLTGRVVFEAFHDGAVHKGHVHLRDGVVVEENVRAAYSAFP